MGGERSDREITGENGQKEIVVATHTSQLPGDYLQANQ